MKKTLTINLSGIVFNIDDDAYSVLQTYLDELGKHFGNDEREEIMHDIEARVAELITERMRGRNVVNMSDVEYAMKTLGSPTDFDEASEPHEPTSEEKRRARKFYRDGENAVIGGVASGLAAFLGWSIGLVRLLFVLLLLCSVGWALIVYIVLWVAIPEAKTMAQRLEMRGITPNIENIKKYMPKTETVEKFGSKLLSVFGSIIRVGVIITMIAIAISVFFPFTIVLTHLLNFGIGWLSPTWIDICLLISGIVFVVCPIVGLLMLCIRLLNKRARRAPWAKWTLLVVWILSIVGMLAFGFQSYNRGLINELRSKDGTAVTIILDKIHDNMKANGEFITETRLIDSDFNKISTENAVSVILKQGDKTSVKVIGPKRQVRRISTNVYNGELKIENRGSIWAEVEITMPTIEKIELGDASRLNCDSTLKIANNLTLKVGDASRATMQVECGDVYARISDASALTLTGKANNIHATASDASKISFAELEANSVNATATDASKINIGKTKTLELTAHDASKITYKSANSPKVLQHICTDASVISAELIDN